MNNWEILYKTHHGYHFTKGNGTIFFVATLEEFKQRKKEAACIHLE